MKLHCRIYVILQFFLRHSFHISVFRPSIFCFITWQETMKGMHGKRKIMLQIFEASFHAARMSLTVKTLRITIRPKENRYCSTNLLIPYFQNNFTSVVVAKIRLHYICRINHLRLRSECPYSHKVKPNVLKIIGTAKFWSIIVSLMDHWINYTMVLYVVTKSWLLSSNQYFMNSWHKKAYGKSGVSRYILK